MFTGKDKCKCYGETVEPCPIHQTAMSIIPRNMRPDTTQQEKEIERLRDEVKWQVRLIGKLNVKSKKAILRAANFKAKLTKLAAIIAKLEAENKALREKLERAEKVVEAAEGYFHEEKAPIEKYKQLRAALRAYKEG